MEFLPKVVGPVVDEGGSSTDVGVDTVVPIQPLLGPLVEAGEEWEAGAAEITAHLLLVDTTMSLKAREVVAGMVRSALSITQPGPGTEVKPAVRVQSTRKSPNGGGRGAQRLAVKVVPVTSVTQTKMTTRNPMPKTAPTPPAVARCHLHHLEVPRPGYSPPEVCPLGGDGVAGVEEETCTGAVEMLEDHLEDTELDPTRPPIMGGPQRHQPPPESSTAHHRHLGLKTWGGEEMEERRKKRQLMQVSLRVRGLIPCRQHCPLQLRLT